MVPAQDWFANVMFSLIPQVFTELLICSSLPSTHWVHCPLIPPLSLSSEPAILMKLKCSLPNGATISSLWRNWDTGRWRKLPKVTPLVGCGTSSVQSLSPVRLFATPWTAARQASLSITNSQSLLKLMSVKSVMPSNHLILCRPLLLPPSIFPSIRVFSNESALSIRWP